MTEWRKFDHGDPSTWPLVKGLYAVMVEGDSERDGAHVFYEFGDYQTFAVLEDVSIEKDDPFIIFKGEHDEELSSYMAYYGPIEIPPYRGG